MNWFPCYGATVYDEDDDYDYRHFDTMLQHKKKKTAMKV